MGIFQLAYALSITESSKIMKKSDYQQLLEKIKSEAGDFPKLLHRNEQPQILELRFCGPQEVQTFGNSENYELHESFLRLELLPDGEWLDPIQTKWITLPFSSILAIEESINYWEGDDLKFSTYTFLLAQGIVDE